VICVCQNNGEAGETLEISPGSKRNKVWKNDFDKILLQLDTKKSF